MSWQFLSNLLNYVAIGNIGRYTTWWYGMRRGYV